MKYSMPRGAVAPFLVLALAACGSGSTSVGTGIPNRDDGGAGGSGGGDGDASVAPSGARCAVARTGAAGVVVKGTLLLASGPLDGELFVGADGKIACAAASCASTAGYADAAVLACGDAIVSPGFVNAHDHTDYNAAPPLATGTVRYEHRHGWREGTGGAKPLPAVHTSSDPAVLAGAELRFVLGGATSVNGSGGTAGLARNLAAYKNPAWTEGLAGSTTFFDTFPLGDSDGTELASGCGYPKIRASSTAFSGNQAYTPHIAEGINDAARNELTCLTSAATTLVTAQTGIIHAVGLDANDVAKVASAGAKVIWSPRSNVVLYGNTAPIPALANAGVSLALGTDWLASGSMNMLRELACADSLNAKYFHGTLSDRALVEAASRGGAIATGFGDQLGELSAGHVGDVVVFLRTASDPYRAVLDAGVEDVQIVLRGGKALYGDAAIVDALGAGCEALDVCGVAKKACIDVPNVTLAAILAAADKVYPLFFCKGEVPSGEPSCVPYRDTYPNGTSATDRDGDGVDDATDDCPDVFDPPRPMDGAGQADVDGDGAGDACDASPLDAARR